MKQLTVSEIHSKSQEVCVRLMDEGCDINAILQILSFGIGVIISGMVKDFKIDHIDLRQRVIFFIDAVSTDNAEALIQKGQHHA